MDEGPPLARPVPGGNGKERCVEAHVRPPSVEEANLAHGDLDGSMNSGEETSG